MLHNLFHAPVRLQCCFSYVFFVCVNMLIPCCAVADTDESKGFRAPKEEMRQRDVVRQQMNLPPGLLTYYCIDDWDDVPLFSSSSREIQIWADGRVSWHHSTVSGKQYYFKSSIPRQKVEDALKKMKDTYATQLPSEFPWKRNDMLLCFSFAHGVFDTRTAFSTEFFKYHFWDRNVIASYKTRREALRTSNREDFLFHLRAFLQETNNWSLSPYFSSFVDGQSNYSENDLYAIGRLFVADVEFLILFDAIVDDLFPKEDNVLAVLVNIQRKDLAVERTVVDNKVVFEYQCLTNKK